ncbi:MAG: hypothetical protein NUV45_03625 [Tepidanaerobacteraceae bacterium]|jgi:putative membrane fusion protein|nr:hypothetical protein [Tepidanaerobacteraceae bacterium]
MQPPINRKVVFLKQKKTGSFKLIWICGAAAILILIYLLFEHYYIKTYTVRQGTIHKNISAEAIIVKKETVINSPADGKLQIMVKPGERVRVGTPLFMVITDPEQKENYEKHIADLQKNIKDMQDSLNSSVSLNVLNKSIDDVTKKLKDAVANGQFDRTKALKNELAKLTDEKQKKLQSGKTSIKSLEESVNELKKKLSSIELLVNAPEAGIVSFNIDGMEEILTPDNVKTISVHQLLTIDNPSMTQEIPETAGINRPVLKIVDNFAWYLASDIRNSGLKVGKNYDIAIKQSNMNEKITAKLVDIHDSNSVGVFLVEKDTPEMTKFRKVNLEIATDTVSGNMIPVSGIVNMDGEEGVYLMEGGSRVFRSVKVISSDESYAIVEGLKLGDKILLGEKGSIWKH